MNKNVRVIHSRILIKILIFLAIVLQSYSVLPQDKTIKFNQLGYQTQSVKVAVIPTSSERSDDTPFALINADTQETVFNGVLTSASYWPFSDEQVHQLDFSAFKSSGRYQLSVGQQRSDPFRIGDDVFDELHQAAIKSYYLSRSGTSITEPFAGAFARPAGHLDTAVKVHHSAATASRPTGHVLSAPRGWYDAGDYGKYVVNSSITTYTLLLAYDQFSSVYQSMSLNIPESSNDIPDLLDEIKWNLDWMEAMQDQDGGVYHKLTALNFTSMTMRPKDHDAERYVIGKSVTATLGFTAVMSMASRVFAEFDSTLAKRYRQRALNAYQWALKYPNALYQQPEDVKTGEYGDEHAVDEFTWAAAELYLLTGHEEYWQAFKRSKSASKNGIKYTINWQNVGTLAHVSLLNTDLSQTNRPQLSDSIDDLKKEFMASIEEQWVRHSESAYNVAAGGEDFKWGSNSALLNNGLLLFQVYRLTGQSKYQQAAFSPLNYVLGTNPTGYSYVTGFGYLTPKFIHNRLSESDDVALPIPGLIAGGPHTGRQDKCDYPGDLPATHYVDSVCSYSTNETAINWNAPLIYLLGAASSNL